MWFSSGSWAVKLQEWKRFSRLVSIINGRPFAQVKCRKLLIKEMPGLMYLMNSVRSSEMFVKFIIFVFKVQPDTEMESWLWWKCAVNYVWIILHFEIPRALPGWCFMVQKYGEKCFFSLLNFIIIKGVLILVSANDRCAHVERSQQCLSEAQKLLRITTKKEEDFLAFRNDIPNEDLFVLSKNVASKMLKNASRIFHQHATVCHECDAAFWSTTRRKLQVTFVAIRDLEENLFDPWSARADADVLRLFHLTLMARNSIDGILITFRAEN